MKPSIGGVKLYTKISLTVEGGESVGAAGSNGAGKSTLLDSIVGLTDWRGQIIFDNVNLSGLTLWQIVKMGISYAPEREKLFPFMSVRDNLLVGAYYERSEIKRYT